MRGARRAAPALAVGALAAVLLLRPLAYGIPIAAAAAFWAIVFATVVGPGVLACYAAGLYRDDRLLLFGQGCTLGLALQGLAFLTGRALGAPWAADLVAVLTVALAVAFMRRERARPAPPDARGPVPACTGSLALLALVACLIQPLFSLRLLGDPIPFDLLYHAGNAAELRHRWPLDDPRVSGLPLNYHVLSYVLPVAASRGTDLPVADALLALAPLFWIALLALQLQNAGRVLFNDGLAGVVGSGVALLHTDPGRILGLGAGAFNSHFATGVYGSPTTVAGLVLLASLTIALVRTFDDPPRPLASLAILLPLGLAAAEAKASVMPAVLGGLAFTGVVALARRREWWRPALRAGLVLGLGSLPLVWHSAVGYQGLVRVTAAAVIWRSPFGAWATRVAAQMVSGPGWASALVLPIAGLWAVGYFGLGGAGAAAFFRLNRVRLSGGQAWALAAAACGAAVGFLLDAPGLSQLFFLYDGQTILALFAGAGLAAAWRGRQAHGLLMATLVVFCIPSFHMAAGALAGGLARDAAVLDHAHDPVVGAYVAGLAWLRTNAAKGSVVFADNPSLLLSAFGECEAFYETGLYTPRGWQQLSLGQEEAYPERVALQERLLRHPDGASTAAATALLARGTILRVVADSVQSRVKDGFMEVTIGPVPGRVLFPTDLFRLEFANPAMHVYRLEPRE